MVILDSDVEVYIKEQIDRFSRDPTDCFFDHVIHPPISVSHFPPIFLWSPMQRHKIKLLCPVHDRLLQPGHWAADVTTPHSSKSPRVVYCIKRNFLLVQQYYICYGAKQHYFLSASQEVLDLMNSSIWSNHLFLRKFHRSAYSRDLIEYIFSEVLNGINFSKISEGLGRFRRAEFSRLTNCSKKFGDHPLFSFPSSSALKTVFLDFFTLNKEYYVSFNSIPRISISADHTFKVAKPIGGYSYDGKYNRNFNKLFIVLSEDNKVAGWKLTNTLTQAEIKPLLEKINTKCVEHEVVLKFVFSDLCCEWRKFYADIFDNVEVKLDLFHACQRVTKLLPSKKSMDAIDFSRKFGLIFRESNDLGKVRCLPTPEPNVILRNLELFLEQKSHYINSLEENKRSALLHEVSKLKMHINIGCVSGIPAGTGTEANERFHRILNRSFLRGTTTISPELAEAVLTLIFYGHNAKILQQNDEDEFYPLIPLFLKPKSMIISQRKEYERFVEGSLTQSPTPRLFLAIMKYTRNTINNISTLKVLCNNRLFQEQGLLYFSSVNFYRDPINMDVDYESDNFQKNIQSFDLSVKGCPSSEIASSLFISVAILLKESLSTANEPLLLDRLHELGVEMDMDVQDIARIIRGKFVENYQCSVWSARSRETDLLLSSEICDSSLSNETVVGLQNTAVDIMSDVLGVSLVVISSRKQLDLSLHSPGHHQLKEEPLFLALQSNSGLFTPLVKNECNFGSAESTSVDFIRCNCRKGCCKTTKCHCVANAKLCSSRCYCRSCQNRSSISKTATRCSCGKNGNTLVACKNEIGKRASKCPCLKNATRCGSECLCKNCCNEYGKRENQKSNEEAAVPRKKRFDKIYKPPRTEVYLESSGSFMSSSWTLTEAACLGSCCKILNCIDDTFNTTKAAMIYNGICELSSELKNYGLVLEGKNESRVKSKIDYLQKV